MVLGKQPNLHSQTLTFAKSEALDSSKRLRPTCTPPPHGLQAACEKKTSRCTSSRDAFSAAHGVSVHHSPPPNTPTSRLPRPHTPLAHQPRSDPVPASGLLPSYPTCLFHSPAAPRRLAVLPSPPPRSRSHAADVTTSAHCCRLKIVRLRLRHSDGSDPGRDGALVTSGATFVLELP